MDFRYRAVDPASFTSTKFTEEENKTKQNPQGSVILRHTILFHCACEVYIKYNKTSESALMVWLRHLEGKNDPSKLPKQSWQRFFLPQGMADGPNKACFQ